MRTSFVLIIGLLLSLAACAGIKPDPAREMQADSVARQLVQGEHAAILAQSADNIDRQTAPAIFKQLRNLIPPGDLPDGKSVAWNHTVSPGGEQYTVERVYRYQDHVLATRTVMVRDGGRWLVAGFDLRSASREELKPLEFELVGKSPLQYAVLAAAIATPLFILFTAGCALRRRRWGWMVASLFSMTVLQVDWYSGAWAFNPLYFNLLGAGFTKAGSPFASWVLSAGLPLPAALFWLLRKHRKGSPGRTLGAPPPNSAELSPRPD